MSIKGVSRNDVWIGIERGKSRKGEIVEYGKRGLRLPFNSTVYTKGLNKLVQRSWSHFTLGLATSTAAAGTLSKKSKLIGDFRLTSCSPEGLENDQSKSTSSHSSISCFVLAPIIFPDYIILFCDNRIALNFRFRF